MLSICAENDIDKDDEPTDDKIDLLAFISDALYPSDDAGSPISEELANLIYDQFTLEFDLVKRTEIMQRYKIPKNCQNLFLPRVNSEIWERLRANVKRTDIRFSVFQDTLSRISSAVILSKEALLESKEHKALPNHISLVSTLTDSMALIGHVYRELSYDRRDAIRPSLSHEFLHACSHVKHTRHLFSDDLSKTIQDIKVTKLLIPYPLGLQTIGAPLVTKVPQLTRICQGSFFMAEREDAKSSQCQFSPDISPLPEPSSSQEETHNQFQNLKSQVSGFSAFMQGPFKSYLLFKAASF